MVVFCECVCVWRETSCMDAEALTSIQLHLQRCAVVVVPCFGIQAGGRWVRRAGPSVWGCGRAVRWRDDA